MTILILVIILLSLVVTFLLWLLFAPIVLRIDSSTGEYSLKMSNLLLAGIEPAEDTIFLTFKILFFTKRLDIVEMAAAPPKKKKKKRKEKKKKKTLLKKIFTGRRISYAKVTEMVWRLIRTFEIRQLHLALDTGNYPLNAQLYAFSGMQNSSVTFDINFINNNVIILDIRNRLSRIAPVLIGLLRVFLFSKKETSHGL